MSARNAGDLGSIPGLGRSPGEGNGNPLQYSCLENPMDGGAWWATVHRVEKSRTRWETSLSLSYYNKNEKCVEYLLTYKNLPGLLLSENVNKQTFEKDVWIKLFKKKKEKDIWMGLPLERKARGLGTSGGWVGWVRFNSLTWAMYMSIPFIIYPLKWGSSTLALDTSLLWVLWGHLEHSRMFSRIPGLPP